MEKKVKPQHIITNLNFDPDYDVYTGYAECPYCGYETLIEFCDTHRNLTDSDVLKCPDCNFMDRCKHFNYIENDTITFSKNSYINKKKDSFIVLAPGVGSFNRLHTFINYIPVFNDAEYWHYLREAYQYSDNTYYARHYLRALFSTSKPYRNRGLMKRTELNYLKRLPVKINVYRAMTVEEAESGTYNVSWTLDYDKAKFFKDDYNRNHATEDKEKTIVELEIDTKNVIAYWDGREEQEIINVLNKQSSLPVDEIMKDAVEQNKYNKNEL
ncbi:MAG: hypothetical protein GWM89_00055, partial [Candidatus Dadabacteria bacterium]|nr:hypothetical protein [Candidatus Dadabacteria bacterium]NIY20835.1 hypothetical protein [Candidatus Dadabacteria bacterium]